MRELNGEMYAQVLLPRPSFFMLGKFLITFYMSKAKVDTSYGAQAQSLSYCCGYIIPQSYFILAPPLQKNMLRLRDDVFIRMIMQCL